MSGFYWSGFNGNWKPFDDVTVGDKPVYLLEAYGGIWYMWLETEFSSPAWVIGRDYNANWFWAWKWGTDLFDDNSDGINGWWYWSGSAWTLHSTEPVLSCSGISVELGPLLVASVIISGDGLDGPGLNGTGLGTNTIPYITDSSSSHFLSIMAGAAIGAVVLVATVIVLLVKRSRKKTKPDGVRNDDAHHVAEFSPTDIAETIGTAVPAEEPCADEVHGDGTEAVVVMENAAPKESQTVNAEK